jgi:hypothetical protein
MKKLGITLFILIWLLCGVGASAMSIDMVREQRGIRFGDFVAASFLACVGPISLFVVGLDYADHKLGEIIPPKHRQEEQ